MNKAKKLKIRKRIRSKIKGLSGRPRLSVYRSNKSLFAQIIDDEKGITLVGVSQKTIKKGTKTEKARSLGEKIAEKALAKKIKKVSFDRGVHVYHGRIKALAEGARSKGLEF